MSINSICIVRLSALGDVLMLLPLIRTLQSNLPQAKITWIISPPAYNLVANLPEVEFIVINKPNNLLDYWRFKKQLANRSYDILLAAQASMRANLLYPFIKAKRKIGFDRARAKDGHHWFVHETITSGQEHIVDSFLKFAQALGIQNLQYSWDLPSAVVDNLWATRHLSRKKPILLIHPAASKAERSWLSESYIKVIKAAQERWQAQVVLIGGPQDFDRKLANIILAQAPCTDLVGKTTLPQLLAVIRQACVLLCPDTGPAHMANAVGTPVVALHAVSNPDISGPYTFRHLVVNYYPHAVTTILKQHDREQWWGKKVHGKNTMALIQVEDVLHKLSMVLGGVDNSLKPTSC